MEGSAPKQALAFVVDSMGGHLSFTTRHRGKKTVLLHARHRRHQIYRETLGGRDRKGVRRREP